MLVGAYDAAVAWHVGAGALGLVAGEVAVGCRKEQHVAVLDVPLQHCNKLRGSACAKSRLNNASQQCGLVDRTRLKQTPESSYVDGGAGGVVVRALVLKRVGGEDGRAHGGAVGLARPVCEVGRQAAQDRALRRPGLVPPHEDNLPTTVSLASLLEMQPRWQ